MYLYVQACASDAIKPEAIRRWRAFVEALSKHGASIVHMTHDHVHVAAPPARELHARVICTRYLLNREHPEAHKVPEVGPWDGAS